LQAALLFLNVSIEKGQFIMHFLVKSVTFSMIAAGFAAQAQATTLIFTISSSDFLMVWELPATPTPDAVFANGFRLDNVSVDYLGTPVQADFTFSRFSPDSIRAGRAGTGFVDLLDLAGFNLFSGSFSAPTFVPGSYSLFSTAQTESLFPMPPFELTVRDASVVPEPESWALFIAGLGLVGASMRLRRRVAHRA